MLSKPGAARGTLTTTAGALAPAAGGRDALAATIVATPVPVLVFAVATEAAPSSVYRAGAAGGLGSKDPEQAPNTEINEIAEITESIASPGPARIQAMARPGW